MQPMSAEATVIRNYLDVLLGLPWGKKSRLKKDIAARRRRCSTPITTGWRRSRTGSSNISQSRRGPTRSRVRSCASSVRRASARPASASRSPSATGREFIRQSLGGVRDEAEIRGHRRTYIGSLPGKIVTNLQEGGQVQPAVPARRDRQAGPGFPRRSRIGAARGARPRTEQQVPGSLSRTRYRPVGRDVRDAPPTASTCRSRCSTGWRSSGSRAIPRTRRSRSRRAICSRSRSRQHGLTKDEFTLTEEGLRDLIRYYTREAGVRTLEREIAKLCRKSLRRILEGTTASVTITPENLARLLGRAQVQARHVGGRAADRRGHRARLDRGRRRIADDRERDHAGQGRGQDHRQAGRGDERKRRRGLQLREGARARLRHQAQHVPAQEHPYPSARRRGAQGWPERGHRHGHLDRLDAERHSGAARGRDDRRGDACAAGCCRSAA
jgi:hypothetical protein